MAAPSFSSFPPSFGSFPDLDGNEKQTSLPVDEGKRKKKRKKEREDRDDKDRRKGDQKHESSRSKAPELWDTTLDDERLKAQEDQRLRHGKEIRTRSPPRTSSPSLFYSDRKGDPMNIQYGGLHAGDVPKHWLVGGGRRILGLSQAWNVLHRSARVVEVGVGNRRKIPGLTEPGSRALLAVPPTRRINAGSGSNSYEEVDGFLRLPSRKGRKSGQAYRSITHSKEHDNSDSDSSASGEEFDISSDGGDAISLTAQQETIKSLEQKLTSDPSSVSTWLSLLSHTLSTLPPDSKNAAKARSEISSSLLSRALSAHPNNAVSKTLRLKYLKAGDDIWHESKLRAEWETALRVGGTEIWMEWFEWRIRVGNKGIDGVVEDATRILSGLSSQEDGEIAQVRVFWRVAVAFHKAGFLERSTAMFQAQAELAFNMPEELVGLAFNYQLDALEEFWESEGLRVGETSAKGWSAWTANGRPDHIPTSYGAASISYDNESDPYRRWYLQETHADQHKCRPTRSTDDGDDSDPFATILFADIRPLLIPLRSMQAKTIFRYAWLSFAGLHIPGFSASLSSNPLENCDDRWACTHLNRPGYLASIFPSELGQVPTADAYAGVIIGREREYASGFGPIKNWGFEVVGVLEGEGLWAKRDVEGVDVVFVRNVFSQLRLPADDQEWDVYALAFEAVAGGIKSALKLSRSFLSTMPNSLPHWAAHAQLERLRRRVDDARKAYQNVLGPLATESGMALMWWNWVEMEWLAGSSEEARRVLLQSVGVSGSGGVALLRARRQIEDNIRSKAVPKEREIWIKLSTLLELLTGTPTSALIVFDAHLLGNDIQCGTTSHESLTVALLSMLHAYGTKLKNPMPPAIPRERAARALDDYPSNTLILGMFLEGEKGQGVWGRVRGILGESGSGGQDKGLARRISEVWVAGWERGRWLGELERTRSGLAAAVQSERTRGSAILWQIYLEFEIRVGELLRAKKMLFRAVGECPLAKELYLLAFGPLRAVFSAPELNGFADTMAERGLRMRKGVDEMLEGWEGEVGGRDEMSESSEDENEIESSAREIRRLKPY